MIMSWPVDDVDETLLCGKPMSPVRRQPLVSWPRYLGVSVVADHGQIALRDDFASLAWSEQLPSDPMISTRTASVDRPQLDQRSSGRPAGPRRQEVRNIVLRLAVALADDRPNTSIASCSLAGEIGEAATPIFQRAEIAVPHTGWSSRL